MRKQQNIAVVYTHFPHYRLAVFEALSQSAGYRFKFYYDPRGIEQTISSGAPQTNHFFTTVRSFRGLMWQSDVIGLALSRDLNGFVFLGNPYILSTWIAAILARFRGKSVFFWTHGWLRRETGIKSKLRHAFYRIGHGLMLYGNRALEIGREEGFAPERLHVIGNSLDYERQKQAREEVFANELSTYQLRDKICEKPFFLIVSRLVSSAGINLAIEALECIKQDCALIVVGSGPEREKLQAMAVSLGVDVRFTGAIYDEDRLARLFVMTTAVIAPGKVGLLAMHALAYGASVITHDDLDRQMPEVEAIIPDVTGAFFKYGDVIGLAHQMVRFLENNRDLTSLEVRRTKAIKTIEEGYTPMSQVNRIISALDCHYCSS